MRNKLNILDKFWNNFKYSPLLTYTYIYHLLNKCEEEKVIIYMGTIKYLFRDYEGYTYK